MKKRNFVLTLFAVMLLTVSVALFGCDGSSDKKQDGSNCSHDYIYCGKPYDYDMNCTTLGFSAEQFNEEQFNYTHAKLCTKCGQTVWESHDFKINASADNNNNDSYHDGVCSLCDAKIYGKHEYDDDGITCKICKKVNAQISYVEHNDGYTACLKSNATGDVVVPNTYNGKKVCSFESETGSKYFGLTSLTLSEGVDLESYVGVDNYEVNQNGKDLVAKPFDLTIKGLPAGSALTGMFASNSVKTIRLENITTVGNDAFSGCTNIEEFYAPDLMVDKFRFPERVLPATATLKRVTIGAMPFGLLFDQFADTSKVHLDSITFTNGMCFGLVGYTSYIVADSINIADDVTSLVGGFGDIGNFDLKNIEYIDNGVFDSYENLTSVDLSKVKYIGRNAFSDCVNLESVIFGNDLVIDEEAFRGCTKLKEIEFKANTKVDRMAFNGCVSLEKLTVGSGSEFNNDVFNYFAGDNVSFKEIHLGDGVTANLSFKELQNVTELYLGNVAANNYLSFDGLGKNTENGAHVTIGKNVETVKNTWFQNIDETNTLPNDYGMPNYKRDKFDNVKISALDFENGSQLKTIEPCAFAMLGLKGDVVLPNTVESVGAYAFGDNTYLRSVSGGGKNLKIKYAAVVGTSVALEEENGVFYYNNEAVKVQNGLTDMTLRNGAELADACTVSTMSGGWRFAGFSADKARETLKTVTIPEGATEINKSAFSLCGQLTTVSLPSTIEKISAAAFYCCGKLANINVSELNNLTTLCTQAFEGCAFTSLTLPASVETIEKYAFDKCYNLATLDLSYTKLKTLNKYYSDNYSVDIKLPDTITEISDYVKLDFLVKDGVLDLSKYNLTKIGRVFADFDVDNIILPGTLSELGKYAFDNCKAKSIDLSKAKITVVDSETFKGCSNLIEVKFPETLTEIKDNAFTGCTNLTTVLVRDDFEMTAAMFADSGYKGKHIGSGYYLGTTLTKVDDVFSVIIKEGTTEIASGALNGVTKLTYIYVPESVTTLTESDFTSVKNLNVIFGSEKYNLMTTGNRSFGFKCTDDGIIYTASGDKATVWGYIGENPTVNIPSAIENKTVSHIKYDQTYAFGSGANFGANFGFAGRNNITAISVASALKYGGQDEFIIDGNVFGNMSSLTKIELLIEDGAQMTFAYGMISGSNNVTEVKFQGKLIGSRIRVEDQKYESHSVSFDSNLDDNLLSALREFSDFGFNLFRMDNYTA